MKPRANPVANFVDFVSKVAARLFAAGRGQQHSDADTYALDLIERLLSDGKTARLYKALVEQERIAGGVSASWISQDVESRPRCGPMFAR